MFGTFSYVYSTIILQNNFLFSLISILICGIISYCVEYTPLRSFFKTNSIVNVLKITLTVVMLASFFIFLLTLFHFFNYITVLTNTVLLNNTYLINFSTPVTGSSISYFNFSIDLFGFVLLFLSYIVGFISLLALDSRLY